MLKVHTTRLETVAVLRLQGQFTNGETEILHELLDFVRDLNAVVLDFERVTTIDAHGLGVLLELREQAENRQIRFRLTNVSRLVGNVLRLARLDSVFQIQSRIEFVPKLSHRRRAPVISGQWAVASGQ